MKFTPDQQRAISSFNRNVIVVAGAGSGKTAVLVQRYLALLDAHPDWPLNALVAITFTEKAAGEMRDRVRQALETRLNEATDDDARAVWAARVGAMDSARIDTFHSLCAAILRANAAEAGIDPAFSVLDEIDARILLDNVIDDALRALVVERDPAVRLFSEYDAAKVRAMLLAFAGVEVTPPPDDLAAFWRQSWEGEARRLVDVLLREEGAAARKWLPVGGVWPTGDDKLLDLWALARDALDRLAVATDAAAMRQEVAALAGIRTNVGSQKVWGDAGAVTDARVPLSALVARARAVLALLDAPPLALDARAAQLLPLWAALIWRVQAMYRDAKQARAALDFDDLEARARHLLRTNAGVRARYAGAEFKHILVDEFQDTNAAQWDIVGALADPAEPGSLFLVGDARQSIYAFRGADVSVFERVRVQLVTANGHESEVTLAQSFRTHRGLVDCFNRVFERILTRDETSHVRDYQITLGQPMTAFRQDAPCADAAVEILLIEKLSRNDPSDGESRRRQEAALLAARIAELVAEGRPVYDKRAGEHRPIGYGDIALLFQSMSNVTLYEDAFKRAGLPFVTVAGRGYFDRQEVWDLINLLKALYNPSDDLALAAVLRSPLFGLSDDALLAMRLNGVDGPPPLWGALADAGAGRVADIADDDRARAEFAAVCLGELSALAGRITIAELLRMALDETGYLATLTGLPDGARLRGNVEKLLDKATNSGLLTLGAFSQYLKDLTDHEAREGEALLDVEGAITLMSVHASKGLEFPLVALADTSWTRRDTDAPPLVLDPVYGLCCMAVDEAQDNKPGKPFAYQQAEALKKARDEAERKRLLYVAATRAQDYLLVSGQVTRLQSGEAKADGWLGWLLDAFDLDDFTVGDDDIVPFAWGTVRLRVVQAEAGERGYREPADRSAWNADLPLPPAATMPALLAEPPVRRDAPVRSLSATQVADLGAIDLPDEGAFFRRRLRRSLFYDAPAHIEQVIAPGQWVSNATIGEIVHKALRWWRFPTEADDLSGVLRSYAWESGVTEPVQVAVAVQAAQRLLRQMQASEVYGWLDEARAVFREVPFVYDKGEHTVHGVVDVIFQRADGSWVVLDYKAVDVPRAGEPDAISSHAERYTLRLGIYAAATREHLRRMLRVDVIPDVMLYYIHHSAMVSVPTERWQAALADFDTQISKLLGQTR